MIQSERFDIQCFSKGLVEVGSTLGVAAHEAATRTCAWVITGGTASGVMDIVGKDRLDGVGELDLLGFGMALSLPQSN